MFNDADKPNYKFDAGGRLYSDSDYQRWKANKGETPAQTRVNGILINNQPVVAIDVHASHPFLVEHLIGTHYPSSCRKDFYHIPEVVEDTTSGSLEERKRLAKKAVKKIVMISLGGGLAPKRWNGETSKELREAGFLWTAPQTFEATANRRPMLRDFTNPRRKKKGVHLQYLESKAFLVAIKILMEKGIPALPMHDELIVPLEFEQTAREAILMGYEQFLVGGDLPTLKSVYATNSDARG